ncbi:MAG: RagB/SusD family nutrient uptake outer membrane protein, partial [Cyclobacteriaceae bacterium]|nr:RagB/SusD family nutrient uptake outer membrane protein [Cyclobacteriaceae bacterium]
IGIYGLAQDLEVLGSMPQIIADYQADNVNFIGSFPTLQEINNYTTLANNGSIQSLWRDNYRVILAANAVIANVPNVPGDGFTQTERNQLIGEAKFLRAIVYFNLVNLFAHPYQISSGTNDGIPLVTDPFSGDIVLYSRATVNEVHTLIEQDLTDAISLLPGDDLGNSQATVGAAHALLSRLYLYREDWTKAASEANYIVGNPTTYVPATSVDFYSKASGEELFTLVNTAVDNGGTGSGGWDGYYEPSEQGGRGDCPFSVDLINTFDPADERLLFSETGDNGMLYTRKFDDGANDASNVPVIRIGEIYLNRAEAIANSGGVVTQEIVDLLNMTRLRAGLTAYVLADFVDVNSLLDAISDERRFELAFEGHRRMDLLRTGRDLRPAIDPDFSESQPGDNLTILPIPQREMDLNSNLTQNTGY